MDWLPESDTGAALMVGLIAFIGALFGAVLGFLSNHITTSRQIEREERDVRRAIYGDYLAAALRLSTKPVEFEGLQRELLLASYRLKIVAPYEIQEAGSLLYESLILNHGQTDDPGERHARSDWFASAVEGFSVLARADTTAPTALPWNQAVAKVWPKLVRLSQFLAPEIAGREPLPVKPSAHSKS